MLFAKFNRLSRCFRLLNSWLLWCCWCCRGRSRLSWSLYITFGFFWLGLFFAFFGWLGLFNLLLWFGLLSLWLCDSWSGWLSRSWSWLVSCYDTCCCTTCNCDGCNCHTDFLYDRSSLNCGSDLSGSLRNLSNAHTLGESIFGFKCLSSKFLGLTENLANCSRKLVNPINSHNGFLFVFVLLLIIKSS